MAHTTTPLSLPLAPSKPQSILQKIVLLIFLAGFGSIFVVTGIRGHLNIGLRRIIFFALFCAAAYALHRWVLPKLDGLSTAKWNSLFYGGLALLFIFQICSGFLLLQDLTTSPFDTEAVLRTATQLAQGIVPAEYNDYFSTMDSNVFCMFVLYWMYRPVYLLTGSTGPEWAMLLNTLFLFIAAFAVCHTAKNLWGRKGGGAALVLCLCFLPYYIFTAFVYTDTLAAPFVACSIWGFTALRGRWNSLGRTVRFLAVAGLGILVGAGFLAKGNVGLLYPAFGIYLLLTCNLPQLLRLHWKTAIATLLIFLVAGGAVTSGFNAYKRNCGLLNYQLYDALHVPTEHWLMMGLEGNGAFSQASYQYTGQYPSIAEKKAAIRVRLASNVHHLLTSPKSLAWLMYTKAETNWMFGLFTAPQMVNFSPVRDTWLAQWFHNDGKYADITDDFGQAFYWMIWAGAFLAAIQTLRKPDWKGGHLTLLCVLCLLGNLAFLSLWESNSRYAFCYSCCMLLPICGVLANDSSRKSGQTY